MKRLILFLICLPLFTKAQTNCVKIEHNGYITYFDTLLKYPKLVEWWDTKERCVCDKIPRKDQFAPDPILENYTDLQSSYELANRTLKEKKQKGFDRGHMSPAADNKCPFKKGDKVIPAEILLLECFYFSNMSPQYHSLNAGDWKKLEERTRLLAIEQDSIYIWCGSTGNLMSFGNITIPEKCWKVIYIMKTKTFESYIFNNSTDKPCGLEKWKVDKEEIEKLIGFKIEKKK